VRRVPRSLWSFLGNRLLLCSCVVVREYSCLPVEKSRDGAVALISQTHTHKHTRTKTSFVGDAGSTVGKTDGFLPAGTVPGGQFAVAGAPEQTASR